MNEVYDKISSVLNKVFSQTGVTSITSCGSLWTLHWRGCHLSNLVHKRLVLVVSIILRIKSLCIYAKSAI